jgi:hypothetical protein
MMDPRGLNCDFTLVRGTTFVRTLYLADAPIVYRPITGITNAAPVRITAVGHGLVTGLAAAVADVVGMTEINAAHSPPRASDYRPVTVIDVDHIEFNDISSLGFGAYVSGGALQYYTPVDLTGALVTMNLRDEPGGNVLLALTSPAGGVVLDNTAKTVTITITDVQIAALTRDSYAFDAEIKYASGRIDPIIYGYAWVAP